MRVAYRVGLVATGSALGGLLRWGVGSVFGPLFAGDFPWDTFAINMTGCLFLGWFSTFLLDRLSVAAHPWLNGEDLRLLCAVGFTGAYTTFSTYEYEAHNLMRDGDGLLGIVYLLGSVFLGLVAVRAGTMLARLKVGVP